MLQCARILANYMRLHLFVCFFLISCIQTLKAENIGAEMERKMLEEAVLAQQNLPPVTFNFKLLENTVRSDDSLRPAAWFWGNAVLSWIPDSLIKLNYGSACLAWSDGASPYYEEEKTICYNGKYWIVAVARQGRQGATRPERHADIFAECPKKYARPRWCTPEMFFLPSATIFQGQTLPQILTNKQFSGSVSIKRSADGQVITVTVQDNDKAPGHIVNIELDAVHKFALKRIEQRFNVHKSEDSQFSFIDEIESIFSANDFSFPTKATRIVYEGKRKTKILTYEASNVSLDRATKPETLFSVDLPPGWSVNDTRFKTSFVVGAPLESVLDDVQRSVKKETETPSR